jgi:uncharacterized protein
MFRPPPAEHVRIPGPAGAIEAVVEAPLDMVPPAFGVICHPHPLHGGTLENKVVHTLARTFQEAGAATVRFNFRGVGASEGEFAGGAGESDDASAIVAWGRNRWPGAPLWLAGFSFGAAIAIRIAAARDAALLVSVAPAVQRVDLSGIGMPKCPWLIVQGDADDVVPHTEVQAWAAQFAAGSTLVLVPGVGHFFHGRLHELKAAVSSFLESTQKKSPAGS